MCAQLMVDADGCLWLVSDGLPKHSASEHLGSVGQGQAEEPQFWVPAEEQECSEEQAVAALALCELPGMLRSGI